MIRLFIDNDYTEHININILHKKIGHLFYLVVIAGFLI